MTSEGSPIKVRPTFVAEMLVTDTFVYEVLAETRHTVRLRRTRDADGVPPIPDMACDVGAYGLRVVHVVQEPDPDAEPFVRRIRADGTFRGKCGNRCHEARLIDGRPVRRIDYRF